MKKQDEVDTSIVYGTDEQSIIDHSLGIMGKLVARYNNAEVSDLSIDKTESVIRIVESATNIVKKLADTKLKILSIKEESDDRGRLLDLLTDLRIRKNPNDDIEYARVFEVEDKTLEEVSTVRGELDDGVEQLNITLLELKGDTQDDD